MTRNSRQAAMWSLDSIMLSMATLLFPLYVFRSGAVQPSHLVFLVLCSASILRFGVPQHRWVWLFIALAAYTAFIETYYAILYGDFDHLINPAFFVFNCVLCIGVYHVIMRRGAVALKWGVLSTAVFGFITVYFSGVSLYEIGDAGRSTGSFNNPNQLGYFAACLLSLSYLMYRHKEISLSTLMFLVAISMYLSITSLSKASIIGNFIVLGFVLQSRANSTVKRIGLVVLLLGGAAYLLFNGYLDNFLFFDRILNMGNESDSSLESRGYFAFLEGNPWQVIPTAFTSDPHAPMSAFRLK